MAEQYIESVSELPITLGSPDMQWQQSGNIRAWVDVLGFHNLSRENDKYFIFGDPVSLAIIQSDIRAKVCNQCTITSLTKTQTTSISNNHIIASLRVELKYYETHTSCSTDKKGKKTCTTTRSDHSESATFTDGEIIPERFVIPGNQSVILKQYNGSVYKPQVLNFNLSPAIISYKVTTTNGSLKQYISAGRVDYTSKNVPYMNLTETGHTEQTGRNISKLNDEVVFTSNLTSIEFFTPYGKLNTSGNITKINMPETNIKSGVFGLIYIVFVFFGGLYVMGRTLL